MAQHFACMQKGAAPSALAGSTVSGRTRLPTRPARQDGTRVAASAEPQGASSSGADDWRSKARAIQPGSSYPAQQFCSNCGLCDTYYVAHVKEACAFLGDGACVAAG